MPKSCAYSIVCFCLFVVRSIRLYSQLKKCYKKNVWIFLDGADQTGRLGELSYCELSDAWLFVFQWEKVVNRIRRINIRKLSWGGIVCEMYLLSMKWKNFQYLVVVSLWVLQTCEYIGTDKLLIYSWAVARGRLHFSGTQGSPSGVVKLQLCGTYILFSATHPWRLPKCAQDTTSRPTDRGKLALWNFNCRSYLKLALSDFVLNLGCNEFLRRIENIRTSPR